MMNKRERCLMMTPAEECHEWVLQDGLKMGKSLGNVLDPVALVQAYGADAVRFFFLKEVDFGQVDQHHDHTRMHAYTHACMHACMHAHAQQGVLLVLFRLHVPCL